MPEGEFVFAGWFVVQLRKNFRGGRGATTWDLPQPLPGLCVQDSYFLAFNFTPKAVEIYFSK